MPLNHGYGVVVGTFASFTREDPNHFGHWYHGKLRVDTPAGRYEAALDVDTPSGVGVSYRLVSGLRPGDIPLLAALPAGFTALDRTPIGGGLDYLRSSVLRDRCRLRRLSALRPAWLPWPWCRTFPWVRSDGDNALDVLEPLLRAATRIYVLGEPYTTGLGVHNVHLNQGDPPGPHRAEDGIWQDGAVICEHPSGAVHVWQIKFNTQSLHTDESGWPI
jgi:Uncharacterized conserved protein (DUF2278)